MIRAIINFLLKLRHVFQALFAKVFSKFRDEKTGKLKGITPNTAKNVALVAIGVFFLGILLFQIFGTKTQLPGGLEDFQKEMTPKLGLRESEQTTNSAFGDDPLAQLNNLKTGDPLADLKGGTGSSTGSDAGGGKNIDPANPTVSDCLDIVDKLKNGTSLSAEEKEVANTCIEKNIAQLSPEELAAVKMLARDDLSQEERDAIRKKLSGDTDPDSLEGKIVDSMIEAARKGETDQLQDARNALAALDAKNEELAEALLKKANDENLSPKEEQLVKVFEDKIKTSSTSSNDPMNSIQGSNREEITKNLSQDIANREGELRDLQQQLSQAQAEAAKAGEKIAKGLALSKAEQDAIKKLTEMQSKQEALAKLQKARLEALAKNMNELNKTLTQAALTVKQSVPSGISVEIDQTLNDCNNVKALPIKTAKKGKGKGKPTSNNKEVWLTSNGESLTPDRIKLIQLLRNKKAQQDKTIADIRNPLGGQNEKGLGEKLDVAQVFGEEGANVEIASLTVFSDKSLKTFNLTPDMKIPAVLDSEILISDKGSNQMVRVRIIDDVHNPETGAIVIPKGSIAMAQTSGFDPDTGVMDLSFDKVTVGSGKVLPIKMSIGSADGTMGLKGQVRDTRGKFLLGAFITSFTAGALNWFSQQVIQEYITATDAGNALLGASLQGGSDVMNRIAEMYAGDLQNAAKIYYVPKKIPVVLFPN